MEASVVDPVREDLDWMRVALEEAARAAEAGEVPVGAVLVVDGTEAARGHNRTIVDRDPSAHAEIVALRAAASRGGDHRVGGTLYVTLEPCVMCMGALVQARVERLVFATRDPKAGAAVSLYQLAADSRLNHRFPVAEGPLAEEASELLRAFFRVLRSAP
ncbi:MAG: tRNA adenosine(34) deaminase TadA [Candidatus Binatia bacterium]